MLEPIANTRGDCGAAVRAHAARTMGLPFVVERTVTLGVGFTVDLRVALSTALVWTPHYRRQPELMVAAAEQRAQREGAELLRRRGATTGSWRITWGGNAVEIEPID
jgi:hypothetical protein